MLRLGVLRIIRDRRYVTTVRSFEHARDLVEVDAGGADVVLQSEVVPLAAFRQQTLLDDHIRDDLVGDGVALGRTVRVLDHVDAHWFDKAVGADLQNFVDTRIGGQHQCDDGRPEQHAAVGRLRVKAHLDDLPVLANLVIGGEQHGEVPG